MIQLALATLHFVRISIRCPAKTLFLALTLLFHLVNGFRNGNLHKLVTDPFVLYNYKPAMVTYDLRRLCRKEIIC